MHYLTLKYLSCDCAATSNRIGANPIELHTLSVLDLASKIVTGIDTPVNDLPINNDVPMFQCIYVPILVNRNLITDFYAAIFSSLMIFNPPFLSSLMKSYLNT